MDMRYGLAWRLHCDQVLTLTTGPGLHHFWTFLQRGADDITSDIYLQAAIPGRFCPNFGFHFKPHNEVWPTLDDPIAHFKLAFLVGLEAQDYNPVILEVHSDRWAPIPALLTRDERSTQRHCASTPRHTRVSPRQLEATRLPPPGDLPREPVRRSPRRSPSHHLDMAHPPFNPFEPAPATHALPPAPPPYTSFVNLMSPTTRPNGDPARHQLPPGFQQPTSHHCIQPFSPPPLRSSSQLGRQTTSPFTQPARSLFPPAPGPNVLESAPPTTSRRSFNYITASIYTDEQRANADMEFLSICLLLTHFSPSFALYDTAHHCPILPDQNLFPREPCKHARREILANLEPFKPTLLHNSGRTYLASILSAQGIDFHQAYYGAFFTNQFFHSLVSMVNWAVSPHSVVLRKDILACVWAKFRSSKIERKNIWDEDIDAILKEIGTGEKVLIMMRKHHFW
jgi:hypothetical protein